MKTEPAVCHGDTLVDKLLGAAYGNVKAVADNLLRVLYVADNMQSVYDAAQHITLTAVLPTGTLPSSVVLPLPTGMSLATIRGTKAAVHFSGGTGVVCFDTSVVFDATTATVDITGLGSSSLGGTLYLTVLLGSGE